MPEPGTLIIQWFDGSGGDNPINLGTGTLLNLTFSNFAGGSADITFSDESNVQDASGNDLGATFSGGVVAESLASVTIGDVQESGLNQTATVPLSGQDLDNVGSVSLKVAFDTDILQFEGATNNSGIGGFNAEESSDGVITISGFSTSGVSLGSDFAELDFTFLGGASDVQVLSAQSEFTDPQSNPIPTEFTAGTVSGDEPTISVPDQGASAGEPITVPVNASELQAIGSATIDVTFNSASLTFSGDQNRLQGFDNLEIQQPEPGLVRITGFSTSGVDPADNDGRIVDLEFSVASSLSNGDETSIGFDATSEILSPSSTPYNMTFDGGRVVVESPSIAVDPASVDYGTVQTGNTASETVTITNEATETATLEGEVSLSSGTDAAYSIASGSGTYSLGPGESQDVTVEYAPSEVSNPDEGALQITSNDTDESVSLTGQAEAPQVAVDPASVDYGVVAINSTASQTVTITNEATETATLEGEVSLSSGSDAAYSIASGSGTYSLGPGESQDVTVEYGPSEVSNPDEGTLQITSNDTDESVSLTGQAEAPQIAASIDDATVRSGESLTLTQTVSNEATEVAVLEAQIASTPDFLTLVGATVTSGDGTFDAETLELTLQPGSEAEIEYSFQESVESTTTFDGTISHQTNDPSVASPFELGVSVTVEAAQIAVDPGQLDYGTVQVGTEATETITIENTNGATLTVSSVEVGAPFSVTDAAASGFEVPGGETQTVDVTYAPTEETADGSLDEGTVSIAHDADNASSPAEVSVQGAAEAPAISASIDPSETEVRSGESLTLTQTVSNEATEVAVLEAQVTSTPDFLTFENATLTSGSGTIDGQSLTLQPGSEAEIEYSFQESVDSTTTFDGTISHETNDPSNQTVDLPVSITVDLIGVAITGAGPDGLDRTFSATPGDSTQPVGTFRLTAGDSGASLTALTLAAEASNATGVTRVALWASSDDAFAEGDDTMLASQDLSGESGFPSEVVVSEPDDALPAQERYYFVTVSLASDAGGEVTLSVGSEADVSIADGQIRTVNGSEQTQFTSLPLSAEGSALPVELANFEGASISRDDGGAVRLTWQTASEQNNAGFQIQRKAADKEGDWTTIGHREGAGTTTESQTYRFTDEDLPYAADKLTYRLRQEDLDGTTHTIDPITVERQGPQGVELLGTAPNPVRNRATVRFAVPEETSENVQLKVYDVMGRRVQVMDVPGTAGRHKQTVDVSGLSSGMYILQLSAGNKAPETEKMTVVR